MFTYFLVPVLHAGYLSLLLYSIVDYCLESICSIGSSKIVFDLKFTCIFSSFMKSLWREARGIYNTQNKQRTNGHPTSVLTHAGTVWNFEKQARGHFFIWVFSQGKTSSFERNTILSNLPGTLKVFWWLTYPGISF